MRRAAKVSSTPLVSPSELSALPKLVVFDLDDCLWTPEMYTLSDIPTQTVRGDLLGQGEGAIGALSGGEEIRLFPEALRVLQAVQSGLYPQMRIAAASSADTPQAVRIARASLSLLEVLPGVSLREVFRRHWPDDFEGNLQIGRTPPLSSDKSRTHFPILREQTGIDYADMLFFDDCNWGDHCAAVTKNCPGVVARRTPHGLTVEDWNAALRDFDNKRKKAANNS